jgi:Helix-turn-helix domain
MPRAVPTATRQDIVERHNRGQTLPQIAADLGIPFGTVRDLWRGFRDGGADGLVTGYHACGCATPAYPDAVVRRTCRLRRTHPKWGAGRIRVELLESLPRTASPRCGSCSGSSSVPASTGRGARRGPRPPRPGPRPPTSSGRSTPSRRHACKAATR